MAPRISFLFNTLFFQKYETIETHARTCLTLIILALDGVTSIEEKILFSNSKCKPQTLIYFSCQFGTFLLRKS